MTGKTHIALGIASALTISHDQPLKSRIIILTASIIGSLAPDLDHPKALLNQRLLKFNNDFYRLLFYLSLSVGFIYLYLDKLKFLYLLLGLIALLVGISVHRGFTHSIIGLLAFISAAKIISTELNIEGIYIGFSTGYVLHLIADFFTPRGIKLFYPMKGKTVSPITITSGGYLENIVFSIASIYSIYMLLTFINI